MQHRFSPRRRLRESLKTRRPKARRESDASVDRLRPGARVLAYLNIEGRSLPGVVLEIARRGVWIQLSVFPAPILVPIHCVQAL